MGKRTKSVARWVAFGWTCGVEDGHDKINVDEGGDPVTGPKTQVARKKSLGGVASTPQKKSLASVVGGVASTLVGKEKLNIGAGRGVASKGVTKGERKSG